MEKKKKETFKKVEKKEVLKKTLPQKFYVLKKEFIKSNGEVLKKGEKISLTKEGYKFFSKKNIV